MKMRKIAGTLSFIFVFVLAYAQESSVDAFDEEYLNWYNKDLRQDKVFGASVDLLYNSILKNRKVKDTIIVAVIDGGVDIHHEDFKGKIWVNEDEIPNNGIDDDRNGYIDDIHGWNYLGNTKGFNTVYDNLEYTRIVRDTAHPFFAEASKLYNEELEKRRKDSVGLANFQRYYDNAIEKIVSNTGIKVESKDDLKKVKNVNPDVYYAKSFLEDRYAKGFSIERFEKIKKQNEEYLKYMLNLQYNARLTIGDNPDTMEDMDYGNNNVVGERASHGTSVASIIAANRNNGIGINGVCENVKIMALRVVPQGDEWDKDIALAIRYAVDNGARIINMSFGKLLSPNKQFVDDAIKYAEQHDVLLVHAAGNMGFNLDKTEMYPSDRYADGTEPSNFINIGASGMKKKKHLPAKFSNYGLEHVDLFAPGENIVALDSANMYDIHSGTSAASPVVSGIAALILSYYPELSSAEVIQILQKGCTTVTKPKKVIKPNLEDSKKRKAPFGELSKFGGVVNAYNSFIIAEEMAKKK